MKRLVLMIVLCSIFQIRSSAQEPITEIIKAGVVKVIKAVDLQIQRLQNETICLQNAQQVMENTLSKLKLQEIADWVEKQRTLYADYFDELQQVKSVIVYYHRVREITALQGKMVQEYRRAYALFRQDKHFTAQEIEYMEQVYAGILKKSVDDLDQIHLVVNAFSVSMTDAERMAIIHQAADEVERNYFDLHRFNTENQLLSLQRSKDAQEIKAVKALYGIE